MRIAQGIEIKENTMNIPNKYRITTTYKDLKYSSTQSRSINHAKIIFNEVQSLFIERFGKNICKLIVRINKLK